MVRMRYIFALFTICACAYYIFPVTRGVSTHNFFSLKNRDQNRFSLRINILFLSYCVIISLFVTFVPVARVLFLFFLNFYFFLFFSLYFSFDYYTIFLFDIWTKNDKQNEFKVCIYKIWTRFKNSLL